MSSLISICYFTKSNKQSTTIHKKSDNTLTQKSKRNIIYKAMGYLMLACIGSIVLYSSVSSIKQLFGDAPMIFILETIAVLAFGVAWITKGETLFPDGEHYVVKGIKKVTGKES